MNMENIEARISITNFYIFYLAIIISITFVNVKPSFADQTVIVNYTKTQQSIFWEKLYFYSGWTLYCGSPFYEKARGLQIEHIYPASWMAKHLGCGSRSDCQAAENEELRIRFNHMEADLHNLYPAMSWANSKRSNHSFGMIAGEEHYFEDCDFEIGARSRDGATIVEPRPKARGEIARAMFYMHKEYNLPIEAPLAEMLKLWNQDDPPSWDEIRRNKKIKELQGTKNPFIDNHELAEDLNF